MSEFKLLLGKTAMIHLVEDRDPAATLPVVFRVKGEGGTEIELRLRRQQALQLSHAFKFMAETE